MKELHIHTDGACKGNPGYTSIGFVIRDHNGTVLDKGSENTGYGTNNQAEYDAVIKALEASQNLNPTHVTIYTDSKLLHDHFNGKALCKDRILLTKKARIHQLTKPLDFFHVTHIYRNHNKDADSLANLAFKARKHLEHLNDAE